MNYGVLIGFFFPTSNQLPVIRSNLIYQYLESTWKTKIKPCKCDLLRKFYQSELLLLFIYSVPIICIIQIMKANWILVRDEATAQ